MGCRYVLIYDVIIKKGEGIILDIVEKVKDWGKWSFFKKESLLILWFFLIFLRVYCMILFKIGGRREVNISIFFFKLERRFVERVGKLKRVEYIWW